MDGRLDCVIVGGGPGGLAAAVYLARFRRRFVLVDAGDSRASLIPLARNLAGFPEGITGRDLLARMRDQARRYGADLRDGRIDTLAMEDGGFRLAGGDLTLWARTVMLATGVKDNAPRLPERLDDAVRRGMIRICPICDGYEGAGERIGVLGSSAHAAAEALFLRTFSDRVSLILVSEDGVLPDDSRRSLDEAGVEVLVAPIETVTIEDDAVSALCLTDGRTHRFDRLYSAFGVTPQSGLAEQAGGRLDAEGRLFVDEHQQTSVPGLYAAGDLVRGLNQISVASGEAAVAAVAIHNSLPPNPA